jgi:protein-disulfide isomerase
VYRDLPLAIHPGARPASAFANCAAAQGQFWPMHDRLYVGAEAQEWGSGAAADEKVFLTYAQELRLDLAALKSCVAEKARATDLIEADIKEAHGRYIENTPTFLLNGQKVSGAYSYSTWQQLIDERLAHDGQPVSAGAASNWLLLLAIGVVAVVFGGGAALLWAAIIRRSRGV